MANISLPNGSTVGIAGSLSTAVVITAISNANPAVATAAAHGYSAGDYVVLSSGWANLDGRVVRVANPASGTFELEGIDTTSTGRFPGGGGAGTAQKSSSFTQVTGILGSTSSGGDQQYWTGAPLESDRQIRIPTTKDAAGIDFDVADDPAAAWYSVIQTANDDRAPRVALVTLSNGGKILYYAYVSMGTIPSLTRDAPMTTKLTLSLKSDPTRYAS